MKVFWNDPRSLGDLDTDLRKRNLSRNRITQRETVPIAVVDDERFAPLTNLRANHYKIQELGDVNDITKVGEYAIVLCDLQGVGTALNPGAQGAHLIREIKKHYPEKFVIAYTGASPSSLISRSARESADSVMKKDANIEDWTDLLDRAIDKVTNPIEVWKEFRNRLLDTGMPPLDLVYLEDRFVTHYMGGADSAQATLLEKLSRLKLPNDVRAIAHGFISSIIFKLIFGP